MIELIGLYLSFLLFSASVGVKDAILLSKEKGEVFHIEELILISLECVSVGLIAMNSFYLGVLSFKMSIYIFLSVLTSFPIFYNWAYYLAIKKVGDGKMVSSIFHFPFYQRIILLIISIVMLVIVIIMDFEKIYNIK